MPNSSTMTEWSMTRSTGTSGLILVVSPPSLAIASRIAARSTTARNAGEVLHQHARRAVLDLAVRMRVLLPVDQRLHIIPRHGEAAILETQQIFEQHLHAERQARDVAQLCRGLVERIISE
jgi:hypothetical protein